MTCETLITDRYVIGEIALTTVTNSRYIKAAIDMMLSHFKRDPASHPADICFTFRDDNGQCRAAMADIPNEATLVYTPSPEEVDDLKRVGFETLLVYRIPPSKYWVSFGSQGLIRYDLARGTADGQIGNARSYPAPIISSYFFFLVLSQILKAKGYFPIHSAAVEMNGKGVLLPGFSGSGKTTTCIALTRGGFGFMSDDRTIFRHGSDGRLELLAFPEHVDVTDDTIAMFPELIAYSDYGTHQNLRKKSFDIGALYGGTVSDVCVPSAVVYPKLVPRRRSRLVPLPKDEAFKGILPHTMLVLDEESSREHFDLIWELVENVACYTLELGSDLDALAPLIKEVLP